MLKFTFNAYGYAFEKGVDQMVDAYNLAADTLAANRRKIEADLIAYEASVAAGNGEIGEWEDGYKLWSQDQLLSLQIENSADATTALRRAFIMALYHHWERWVRREFAKDEGNHGDLVRRALKHGLAIDPRLNGVRDVANLLKHSNPRRGLDLLSSWPELLPPHFTRETKADWYEAVSLTDQTVQVVAEIVKASGPRMDQTYELPNSPERMEP